MGRHCKSPQLKFLTPSNTSPTTGAWPRRHNDKSVWYVLKRTMYLWETHTKFGTQIFEIYFVIEI